ncbi:FAD-binding oxidoreductase [Geothrix sp. PMB-07]|uniref:FAD-binding oxidoreductase n=1 Tax=Geothrix sp. PMB-07 TaxID=3068640 RepID=UPI0027408149|nr:FAD-binding oxidoreductase [Geothrix sp. PMB-07]WLT32046.1 FAD-binding oxidoreductase [Geothrix sp. PMB-07]
MDALKGLPEATVIHDPSDLEPFLRDESHVVGRPPLAVVKPHGPVALRELVRLAKAEGFGLVPRGAGTGKAGGCLPTARSVVVDFSQWPGEIQVSPQDLCLSAPVSAPLREVKAAAAAQGLFYPPDPNSWESCALGGTLATNAGGPNACKYGMTRHWVLAVDVLLEDGDIHRFGISSVKANAGPALGQLFIGSEGLFGFIVGATLRLTPMPREHTTLLLPVKRWEDLLDLPGRLCGAGYLPSAFEFFDPAVLAELRAHGPETARRLPGEALAILEFDERGCASETFLEGLLDLLGPVAEGLELASDERQRENIWAVRRMTSAFLKERHPKKVSEDIVVPRSRLREFFAGLDKLGGPTVTYGHLGDGNLHVNLLAAGETEPALLERQVMELFRLSVSLGGTLSGEHGIGLAKRDAFLALSDPAHIHALRALKQAMDPQGIFNPGKVI